MFRIQSSFKPTGDQPQAIALLSENLKKEAKNQVLLGVTGSGKTFTIANVIQNTHLPTLIISHNKTLAGQLYQEMRDFFPHNAVSYFVSYYDYYQPEAYIPHTDTYIEKEAQINEQIDRLRLESTMNILSHSDCIVVASVSCIYNIGSPQEYKQSVCTVRQGDSVVNWDDITERLVRLQYHEGGFEFTRGTFRLRGNFLDIYPAYEETAYRVERREGVVSSISVFHPVSGKVVQNSSLKEQIFIFPAKHFMTDPGMFAEVEPLIKKDLAREAGLLRKAGKVVEAERLTRKVNYDLEMIREVGYVNGIENYSRYFDGRKPGDSPYTLIHYFQKAFGNNFLVVIDESHMTVPQLRGMSHGDEARKKTLIDYGFRLSSAKDNRPLRFDEFYPLVPHCIYTSATPNDWELEKAKKEAGISQAIVEQLVRPTGIVDPQVYVRPAVNQIEDLEKEIQKLISKKQRTLVTTLTKKTAEDLSEYLIEKNVKATYLHSDIKTLERSDILDKLRKNEFDVLIGVNLLREGLDLPEVALVAILDADKEGFLRSRTSLIQTMGRAARNVLGYVILYADKKTDSMMTAINEINRRREYQISYNKMHSITPESIYKPIRERIMEAEEMVSGVHISPRSFDDAYLARLKKSSMTPYDRNKIKKKLEREMKKLADDLQFERAIDIRNAVRDLEENTL